MRDYAPYHTERTHLKHPPRCDKQPSRIGVVRDELIIEFEAHQPTMEELLKSKTTAPMTALATGKTPSRSRSYGMT